MLFLSLQLPCLLCSCLCRLKSHELREVQVLWLFQNLTKVRSWMRSFCQFLACVHVCFSIHLQIIKSIFRGGGWCIQVWQCLTKLWLIINLVPFGLFCYIIYLGLPVLAGSPQHVTTWCQLLQARNNSPATPMRDRPHHQGLPPLLFLKWSASSLCHLPLFIWQDEGDKAWLGVTAKWCNHLIDEVVDVEWYCKRF